MKVVAAPGELTIRGCAICIGNFDGVHLGHQLLLKRLQHVAQKNALPSVVLTFFPPAKVIFRQKPYLSSAEEKLFLLQPFRPDAVVIVPFSRDYAQTPKEVFLKELESLGLKHLIVGEDFRFGHGRGGGLDDLQHVTERLEVFSLERLGERVIKSSHIRDLLYEGNVAEARKFLGYSYLAIGKVVRGDQRGRTIGFPTANIALPQTKALPLGVFAVTTETPQGTFGGMANVGPRPSFPNDPPALEVHLFDFEGDLYEQTLRVSFEHFLRPQRKFIGLDELKAQLSEDARNAKEALQH